MTGVISALDVLAHLGPERASPGEGAGADCRPGRFSGIRHGAVRALALVGVLLGMTFPALRAADRKAEQARAIAEIRRLGGEVEVDVTRPDMPVVAVNLRHTRLIDASLEHLKGRTELEILYRKDTGITDDGRLYVKGLTNLEVEELGRIKVTDKSLAHLRGFSGLQRLDLGNTEVTDQGLGQLKGLTRLGTLCLDGTQVTDAGLAHLKRLTGLRALSLANMPGVSDLGLAHLKGLTNLRTLNLEGTKVTAAAIQDLQRALPKVQIAQ